MTEEKKQDAEALQEEPQVYTVKKELGGWKFNRRAFLTAAGATAAVAAVGSVAGCGSEEAEEQVITQVIVQEVTATPSNTPGAADAPSATDTPVAADAPVATDTMVPTETAMPTETPTPTSTPTTAATATPALPKAQFVQDVTIPDGTVMKPSQSFTKTWRFKNVGAVGWGEGVKLVFVPENQKGFESKMMGGPDSVEVPNVQPGKNVDVSVDLVSPQKPGHYRSYWRLQLENGKWLENVHYADIYVASEGEVPPGQEGGTLKGPGGETRWLPCGSPIPPGWTCTCNCVSSPEKCSCDSVHYWYPN